MSKTDVSGNAQKGRKGLIVTVVAIVVIALAGAGFWVWHQQPSFCNAICHKPMDRYVETYESGNSSMLSAVHAKQGKVCLDCHEAKLDDQVAEATAWVSGDFTDPVAENTFQYNESFCLNESCHNMTRDELTESTSDMAFNPHVQQHGDIDCGECHKAHSESVMYCTQCHAEAEVPDGWMSYSDYMSAKQR